MNGYVGNTDANWFRFLRSQDALDEVNFWQPSGRRAFRRIQPGEPFFFRLKSPDNAIAGFGIFARHSVLPDWLAWEAFGIANGAPDHATMRARIEKYLAKERHGAHASYPVGCLMVAEPVFFAEDDWVREPGDWKPNIVQGKGYDVSRDEGARLWRDCLERAERYRPALLVHEDAPRFGAAVAVRPRIGQGTFRVSVTEAYRHRCAVTTEHSLVVLEAAHIRPYADGGEHRTSNGLLLRSDVHRLFDRGFVTVTPEHRFEVSPRLREEWDNGRVYYELHGRRVHVPEDRRDLPDRRLLEWHNERKFCG